MIKIYLQNNKCRVDGLVDETVRRRFDQMMSYQIHGHQYVKFKNGWDGRYRLFDRYNTFPIGLFSMAEVILKNEGIQYEIIDQRPKLKYKGSFEVSPKSGFEPRDYQLELVDKAWKVLNSVSGGGIVRACTGSGKTLALSMLTAKAGVKTVIYVIGIELLYQMKATLERAFPDMNVGMVGNGHCDIQDVTVCTIWTAAAAYNHKAKLSDSDTTNDSARKNKGINKEKVQKMIESAEMIIIDECQYAGSDTVQFLHRKSMSAKHRFLFSGTPWRENGDDILIEAVGGPKFFDISASKLIREGWLVPPEIHFINVPVMRGVGKTYHQVYSNFIVNNITRNEKIVNAAKKLVAANKKVLILVTKIEHGKLLLDLLKPDLRVASLDGSNKTADRIGAIWNMKNGELDILIASKIFDQGVDIPELDALILAGSGKSSARALQRIGRVIRKRDGKKKAIVVDFWDNCKYLREHSEARFRIYSTEPEFKIKMPKR